MSVATRLAALEKTASGGSGDYRGADFLMLRPADCHGMHRDTPKASYSVCPNGKTMVTALYRQDQIDAEGKLTVPVRDLIPDGPDHDQLVELASDPGQVITLRYVQWRERAEPDAQHWQH